MSECHDADCPADLVEHIADIEAGWTLPKPWKSDQPDVIELDNRAEIREMIARWAEHGLVVGAIE